LILNKIGFKIPSMERMVHDISGITGVRASRFMMTTVHPDLGGGTLFSLGHPSDRNTSILIRPSGDTYLWDEGAKEPWVKASGEKIKEWSCKALVSTNVKLRQPELAEFRVAGLPRKN
jgi:hypothetical protein